jgi:hypothetical protein
VRIALGLSVKGSCSSLTDLNLEVYTDMSMETSDGALSVLLVPNLQKLTLCMVKCTAADLEALIIAHQETLQDITLICIHLSDYNSWRNSFQHVVEDLHVIDFYMEECAENDDEWPDPTNVKELIQIVDGI